MVQIFDSFTSSININHSDSSDLTNDILIIQELTKSQTNKAHKIKKKTNCLKTLLIFPQYAKVVKSRCRFGITEGIGFPFRNRQKSKKDMEIFFPAPRRLGA